MEVVGRHALFFDDDATCGFVNSRDALVEWNSLLIDRYDVRHLLQSPPPLLKRRTTTDRNSEEIELDQIRYQDLPQPSESDLIHQENKGADGSTYRAVSFSYGNTDVSSESKNSDISGFLPPFSVPESLLQSIPPTEKLHHIIARTAVFVSEHGGQSEIVLRVKQGNNPTFGFLMPDHQLHAYFRFLVDNPAVLKPDNDAKPEELKNADQEQKQTDIPGEALSLLGSVYGSGEDEDGQFVSEAKDNEPGDSVKSTSVTLDNGLSEVASSSGVDLSASKNHLAGDKEKGSVFKKIHSVNAIASSSAFSKKREGNVLSSHPNSSDSPRGTTNASMNEPLVREPPSEIKRVMDKIVEFVLKNGKEFEAVLIEQDRANGRFPFLLPSNQYHPYYVKVIQEAQESKQVGKSSTMRKHDSLGHVNGKRSSLSKDSNTLSNGSASQDLPWDLERKEKFKMVITGSKKDAQEPAPKPTQQLCGMSVDAAAAILQAATGSHRHPKLEIPMKTSSDKSVQGIGSEGGPSSSIGTRSISSQICSSTSKPVSNNDSGVPVPIELPRLVALSKENSSISDMSRGKAIAKTAALAAASEADSSEACLTKEQKLKAERLKRAKMFAAMIKSGSAPETNEISTRLSAGPPDSVLSGLAGSGCKTELKDGSLQFSDSANLPGAGVVNIASREREGSSAPVMDTTDRMRKYKEMDSGNDYKERRSRKRHHTRSRRVHDDDDEYDDDDDDGGERNHSKHSRRKHSSRHSSHHSKEEHKHRKRHSSSKDGESRHRHKHHSSSEDEQHHQTLAYRHKVSRSESKVEPEDEQACKIASRETSLGLITDRWEGSTPLVEAQPTNSIEVSDDLRAKVRAMLLATL